MPLIDVDTSRVTIELVEMNEAQERRHARMHAEALAWDGSASIRR